MTIVRVELAPEFMWGDDVVLLAMDGTGVSAFATALKDAVLQGVSQLQINEMTHEFVIEDGRADVSLSDDRTVWRLDAAKAAEIVENLDNLSANNRPGHQYVDISKPTDTLVLSRDEYVGKQ